MEPDNITTTTGWSGGGTTGAGGDVTTGAVVPKCVVEGPEFELIGPASAGEDESGSELVETLTKPIKRPVIG